MRLAIIGLASALMLVCAVQLASAGPIVAGDANVDGYVDIKDLTIVLSNYDKTGMTWAQGDFNADGTVNGADLNVVLGPNNHYDKPGEAFPPPTNSGSIDLSVIRDKTAEPSYDTLTFNIAALTGPGAGSLLVAVEGTWTVTGGSFISSPEVGGIWMSSVNDPTPWYPGGAYSSTSVSDSWIAVGSSAWIGNSSLLATMEVTPARRCPSPAKSASRMAEERWRAIS